MHTALFTSSPTFDFESSSSLTSSLAASLRTPEPLRSSHTSLQRKWSGGGADSGTDTGAESETSPSNSNPHSHVTLVTNTSMTTEPSPELAPSAEEKGKMRALPYDTVSGSSRINLRKAVYSAVVEETEPEESDENDEEERRRGGNGVEDGDEDEGLFKVGSTPIALRRILSPPPPSSPTPSARSRLRALPTPNPAANQSSSSLRNGNGAAVTELRTASPGLASPSAQTSNNSAAGSGIPRSLGGLGAGMSGVNGVHGSVSSMASASTSMSTSSETTSSSAVTTSSSGRSTESSASGSYRTPYTSSPPRTSSSSASYGRQQQTPRARAQTMLAPTTSASASTSNFQRGVSPPRSASGYSSSGAGSPGSDGAQDRERGDADVFSSRPGGFVDPLLLRKREKERRSMEVKATALAVAKKATDLRAPGKKPPINELVAFFQATTDS